MELNTRWRKLAGDVRNSRGRILMMLVALAVGVLSVTTILSAYAILTREISLNYLGTHPATVQMEVTDLDPELVDRVRHYRGIVKAEIGATLLSRIETKPGEWLPLMLFVVPDFNAMQLNTFRSEAGAWPPPPNSILIERSALAMIRGGKIGAPIHMRLADGSEHNLTISGLAHDPGLAPAWQEQTVYGYATPATVKNLGQHDDHGLLKLSLDGQVGAPERIDAFIGSLASWIRAQGHAVGEVRVPPPGKHPHQTQMNAILTMLIIFSAMALILSGVLTATLIDAMLASQVRQIGIMKTIGARSWQIAQLNLVFVGAVGVAALMIALPLGLLAGRGFARAISELLNFNLYSEAVPAWVVGVAVAVALLVPILSAMVPVLRASAISIRAAISDFGVSRQPFGGRRFDRLLGKLDAFDRPLLLAMRNSFRRRGRLLLTVAMLAAAGSIFITSLNVRSAWEANLAAAGADRHYDLELRLAAPVGQSELLAMVAGVPGVQAVEAWNIVPAAKDRPDGLDVVRTYPDGGHGSFTLRSMPVGTRLVSLHLLDGRWLEAGDTNAVVLNHNAQAMLSQAQVGSVVDLRVNGHAGSYKVVGIAREIITPAAVYISPAGFARATGSVDQANAVRIAMRDRDPSTQARITDAIRTLLATRKIAVEMEITESRLDGALTGHVYILIVVLVLMAFMMAIVGVLGLASTMSSSVIERTREFGVMRTIGARGTVIMRNVVAEGMFIGILSMLFAVLLSLPLSLGIGRLVGTLAFRLPLPLVLSPLAYGLWLLLILFGATLASAFPARQAAQLTIRQTLAFT